MNEHPRTLLDDLDEAPVGTAPVGHLVTGGQAAKRRKQRAFVAGAAAVTALVVGGSALALQGIPGSNDDRDSNDPLIADSAAPDLAVEVEVGVAEPLAALIDGQDGRVAIWNPGPRTVAFVPAMGYSSSCPPLGTAGFTDSGVVTLTVRDDPATDLCTADAQPVTVTIGGLTTAPSEVTVTVSGETDTIPVKSLAEGQAPASAAELVESGDGLRVENKTAEPVILVLADGATAQVDVGKVVTLHMPCRERFPLRAESTTGQLIAERDGPCLRRDTWTLD